MCNTPILQKEVKYEILREIHIIKLSMRDLYDFFSWSNLFFFCIHTHHHVHLLILNPDEILIEFPL
jgi:hypothetical protein